MALAILTPVLIFIGTATRGQVSLIAAIESTAAAVLGTAIGFGLFFLLRIPVAGIPFVGQPFFPAELTLSLPDIVLVALGVPLFAAVAARMALRQVNISPLGVARRARPKPPGAWRVIPLLAGLAELGFWTIHGHPASETGQIQARTRPTISLSPHGSAGMPLPPPRRERNEPVHLPLLPSAQPPRPDTVCLDNLDRCGRVRRRRSDARASP